MPQINIEHTVKSKQLIVLFSLCALFAIFTYFLANSLFLYVLYGIIFLIGCLILLRSPFVGLLLLVALIPAEEIFLLPEGNRTILFVLGMAVVCFWLINVLQKKNALRFDVKSTTLASLFFVYGLLSYFWAKEPALVLTRATSFLNMVIFYILFQGLVKNKKQLNLIFSAFFFSCCVYSLISITMYLGGSISRLSISETQNPNMFAINLGLSLMMAFYFFKSARNFFLKSLIFLAAFLPITAILMSGSRGVWLAFPLAIILVFLASSRKAKSLAVGVVPLIIIVVFIKLILASGFISLNVTQRLSGLLSIEGTQEAGGRLGIYGVAVAMIKDNPILGVGWDNFSPRIGDWLGKSTFSYSYGVREEMSAHNSFLMVQSELGIIGTLLFLLFLWTIFKKLFVIRNDLTATTALLAFVFMFLICLKADIIATKIFWLVMALATVVPMIIRDENSKETIEDV